MRFFVFVFLRLKVLMNVQRELRHLKDAFIIATKKWMLIDSVDGWINVYKHGFIAENISYALSFLMCKYPPVGKTTFKIICSQWRSS